jgi:hypothetical protein
MVVRVEVLRRQRAIVLRRERLAPDHRQRFILISGAGYVCRSS